ncbi:MAG: hypothetical protein K8L99_07150 [Anaerolineae bacterium]|nr:hypothetical protein [Anaerolineae bacterium]
MSGETIVAVFPSRAILTKALDRITELEVLNIQHAAIVAKAHDGEIVVIDDDISANEGAITGGTLGAAMTALGLVQMGALALPGIGPIIALGTGLLAGGLVGGLTGRLAAQVMDFEYKNYPMKTMAEQLQAGHPALVLQVGNEEDMMPLLQSELKAYRVEVLEKLTDAPYAVGKSARS